MQAFDSGSPRKYDTETVIVNVNRNTQPPVFQTQNYEITISETQSLGTSIIRVVATDPDALFVSGLFFYDFPNDNYKMVKGHPRPSGKQTLT